VARRLLKRSAVETPDQATERVATERRVIGADRSRMTDEALAQFHAAASLPGCAYAAAMPDLHPGRGIPIGASFGMIGVAYPHLVGSDAGCGASVVFTALDRVPRDRVERRLRQAFSRAETIAEAPGADVVGAAWARGPRGLLELPGLPDLLAGLCRADPEDDGLPASAPSPADPIAAEVLGTIGGGNHFAEIGQVHAVVDAAAAGRLGAAKGGVTVVVHSGSRGVGAALGARWGDRPLHGGDVPRYLAELAGACRFARTNRLLLVHRLLRALGVARLDDVRGQFDIVHNDIRRELVGAREVWVHRKGAAPAHAGAPTIVLGSRGAPSWILLGRGAERALSSVAHGAGRRMSRADARSRLKARYRRDELGRSPIGSRVLCDDPALLYEEHPDAYKPIEPIIEALEEAGCASRVAAIVPVVTVKL
jgi:release factor H-coupled RctB family protein